MIEIQNKYTILVLETQYFSCCLLHFINSYLGIYLKTKKQQNKKANKTKQKRKKKEEGKRRYIAEFEPGASELTRSHIASHSHYAIEDNLMVW